ncbi:hypothetical protein HID58_053032, partial [Brassica napus]
RRSAVLNLDLRRFAASVSGRHSAWEDVSRRFIEHGFLLLSAVSAGGSRQWFKERSSIPLKWPSSWLPIFGPLLRGSYYD